MDFSWSEEQLTYKRTVTRFAQAELNRDLLERDQAGELSLENWHKCAEFGIQGLPFPESYGGSEADIQTTMLAMEGLGYGCEDNGLIFAMNAQMWSVQFPIFQFGSEELKERLLPGLCKGTLIGAHGMTEPDAGSDTSGIQTLATRVDDGYVLSGTKTFVTNGPVADLALVFATVDRDKGMAGLTAFVVESNTSGFQVSKPIDKMGLKTSPMSELVLNECFVSEDSRLGAEGAGSSIFASSMEWERSCILAGYIGTMERQLEASVRYARERRQFGQPIGKFQSVANRIADMKVRLETARLLLYYVAWKKSTGKNAALEAAMAKLYLSECFVDSSFDAVRIHGGYGYTAEFGFERDFRDSVGGVLYSGTSDIQRVIIARLLGL